VHFANARVGAPRFELGLVYLGLVYLSLVYLSLVNLSLDNLGLVGHRLGTAGRQQELHA
jgi:hypothetical protein